MGCIPCLTITCGSRSARYKTERIRRTKYIVELTCSSVMYKHINLRSVRDARMCGVEINLPCNSTALTLHVAYHEVASTTRAFEAGGLEAKPVLR